MNKTYTTKEMVSRVVDRLYQQGERIEIGGNRHAYKRKYHLKYSQLIVRKVLDAFLEEMVTVLSEGDTVKIAEYFKLEPKLYAGRKLNSKVCGNNLIIPEQYKPKMKLYKKLKEACKFLTKEDQHLKEEGA